MITPTRRTQPYRKGQQQPGMPLDAMLRGTPFQLPHPLTLQRLLQKLQRRQ